MSLQRPKAPLRRSTANKFPGPRVIPPPSNTMSDQGKSNPSLFFNPPATSGSSSSPFGQTNTATSTPAGGLFGSSANPPASSATNPFGNTSTAGGNSLFGGGGAGGGGGSNLFGGGTNKSAGGSGWSFGQAQGNNASGGLFGTENRVPASSAPPSSGFTGFSTPSKPLETTMTGQSQTPGPFSGVGSTGAFAFGNLGSNTSSAGQTNATTPTSKPTTNLFGNSTTPAGPPPSTSASGGSVLFGKNPPQDAANPFASLGSQSLAPGNSSTAAPSKAFTGFDFGASKPMEAPGTTSTASQSPSIFGSTPSTGTSNLFGNKRSAQSDGGNLFNMNKSQDTGATKPASSQQSQSEAPKTSNLFPGLGGQSSATTSSSRTSSAPQNAFSFLNANQPQSSTINPVSSPTAAPSAFGFFSSPPKSSGTSAPSTTAPANSLFPNIGKAQDKASVPNPEATSTSTTSTPAPAPNSNLFNFAQSTGPSNTSQAATQLAKTATTEGTCAANVNLGGSTAGPPPPAQSRLKNKSMDDIITRWASDLSKYQKEFQKQADKVAAWDRMLVENSEKIQKLYGSTLEAERATTEVERQLSAVESDQETLELWLDHYEKEVDSMLASQQGGQGETIAAPDQERERTYVTHS